jgi:hypothetical protein
MKESRRGLTLEVQDDQLDSRGSSRQEKLQRSSGAILNFGRTLKNLRLVSAEGAKVVVI